MTPALSTIACARVKSASAAARSASQISSAQENDNYISDEYVTEACRTEVFFGNNTRSSENQRNFTTKQIITTLSLIGLYQRKMAVVRRILWFIVFSNRYLYLIAKRLRTITITKEKKKEKAFAYQ